MSKASLAQDQRRTAGGGSRISAQPSPDILAPRVVTLIESEIRLRLEAAINRSFVAVHAESASELLNRAARDPNVRAVVVSPTALPEDQDRRLRLLKARCPSVIAIAVVMHPESIVKARFLRFGASGVHRVVDVSQASGWTNLRQLLNDAQDDLAPMILQKIMQALPEAKSGLREYFEVQVRMAPKVRTVKRVAQILGIQPTTLMSRFDRAGLPSPKSYLTAVRIVYAAAYLEPIGATVADVAYRLQCACPQSLGRYLRDRLGVTPREFRRRYSVAVAIERVSETLILPYLDRLREFDPLALSR